jgi:hypothetical protein
MIFISEEISVWVKALLVKAERFTVKGERLEGAATTLVAYPASNPMANNGVK